MDSDGFVEIPLGRAHANRDSKSLQHLVGAQTEDVATDDALNYAPTSSFFCRRALMRPSSPDFLTSAEKALR